MPTHDRGEDIIIPAHYVNQLVHALNRHGIDSSALLEQLAIHPQRLQDLSGSVSPLQMTNLIQHSAQLLDDEMLGFFDIPTRPGFAVFLFRYMLDSNSLSEYLEKGSEFISQFLPPFDLSLSRQQDHAILELRQICPDTDPNHCAVELFLALFMRMANWAIDEKIRLLRAEFPHTEPDHSQYYPLLFNGPSYFDQSAIRLIFPRQYLKKPVEKNKYDLAQMMKTFPLEAFMRPGEIRSTADRVAGIIFSQLTEYQELPGLTSIARILHTSEQTLRRRLQQENASYREIKDKVRRDIAVRRLTESDDSITEIAFLVGYSEINNFTRAFKNWCGINPSDFRKQHGCTIN